MQLSAIKCNYLLNPQHPDFNRIIVGPPEPFIFDQRFGGQQRGVFKRDINNQWPPICRCTSLQPLIALESAKMVAGSIVEILADTQVAFRGQDGRMAQ